MALAVEENVLRLQVSVDDVSVMKLMQRYK